MNISSTLDDLHLKTRQNRWLWYFAIFNRIALAAGFLPSGLVKIAGERFTSLSVNHPMGHYLEALHKTGYYYTFIGVLQVTAAILLLIPRTVTLGALIYFPIILNISILSFAVRFEGSLLTSPVMVLANLYLLWWNYDKLKLILPFNRVADHSDIAKRQVLSNKFPKIFFAGAAGTVIALVLLITNAYSIRPRNTIKDCKQQCKDNKKSRACNDFCDCIHRQGRPLDSCLAEYNKAPEDVIQTP